MTTNYKNNPNIPARGSEFEYDKHKISELKRCQRNIIHFAQTYFYILDLDKGRRPIPLRKFQRRILRKMRDNRYFIVLASRQIGKTTLMTIYALWVACFNNDQRILIVANKESTAIEILSRIRMAYEELPNWLKPGSCEYAKTAVEFANGAKISISTTTGTAARGQSCNCLIIDEMAFIEDHIVNDFWRSVYPIISSSEKSKIFVSSTANGTGNLFHKLYTKAEKRESTWAYDKVLWNEVPGRGEEWKEAQIADMGGDVDMFRQEYECEFIESGESVINEELLSSLKRECSDPPMIFCDGHYNVWQEPQSGRIYSVGVDVAEGLKQDASVITILDITDIEDITQVASYHNNEITPHEFTPLLRDILKQWGDPLVAIERNNCGAQVVDDIRHKYNYSNVVTFKHKYVKSDSRVGVISHTNTKYKGVANMRYWVERAKQVRLMDVDYLTELENFVRWPNNKWAAKSGEHDDRVLSLVWSLIVIEDSIVNRYFEVMETDQFDRPRVIKPFGGAFSGAIVTKPSALYMNERYSSTQDDDMVTDCPTLVGNGYTVDGDLSSLHDQGWQVLR